MTAHTPELLGALLALARARRARSHSQPQRPAIVDEEPLVGLLVRAYVLPEDERTRHLASRTRRAW